MSNKKTWESLASEAAEQIDQWRARAELAEARVAELVCELADAESITLGALDAALANGEERDSEKVRCEAVEVRVAELEDALLEIDKWQTGENNIEDDEDWEADEVLRRRVRAIVKQALAGRKDG